MQAEPSSAPQALDRAYFREESDDYGAIVAVLNPALRVIKGRCGLQWIAQKKGGARWTNFAFCGTKQGLCLSLRDHLQAAHHKHERDLVSIERLALLYCDQQAWDAIEGLPDYFPRAGC